MTDIVFDKTGTLTTGNLGFTSINVTPLSQWPKELQNMMKSAPILSASRLTALIESSGVHLNVAENDQWTVHCLLWFAGCLQMKSDHPIGLALIKYHRRCFGLTGEMPELIDPIDFINVPGEGIVGTIDISPVVNLFSRASWKVKRQIAVGNFRFCSQMLREWKSDLAQLELLHESIEDDAGGCFYVIFDGHYLGCMGFSDFPKPEAKYVIKQLRVSTFNRWAAVVSLNFRTLNSDAHRFGCALETARVQRNPSEVKLGF